MNPGFVSVVPGSEIVLMITVSVGGQLASGEMKFCLPYVSLEPIMGKLGTEHIGIRANKASAEDRVHLAGHLGLTPIRLAAILGSTELTIAELLSLEAGHVLQLDAKAVDPVLCQVEGEAKFLASAGRTGRRLGVCVQQVLPSGEPEAPDADSTEEPEHAAPKPAAAS